MVALMRLPQYNPGNQLIDLSPINQGLASIQQRQQADIQNERADEQLGMQREQQGMRKQQFEAQQKAQQVKTLANRASVISGLPEGQRQAAWQRMVQASPQLATALQENGVDPNDHVAGPRMIIAEAGQYDPLGDRMKEAQINNLNASAAANMARSRTDSAAYGKAGTIIQDRNGNFYSVQFAANGTRKVEPLQMGQTPLQPSRGTEVVGDTLRDKATGRVIENVGQNIAGAEQQKVMGREAGKVEANYPKAQAQFNMAEQKWARVQPSIERARQLIRSNPTVVGLLGSAAARVPGTAAYRLGQYLETIKSNIGFSELQAMREASPTGGALGQVSEFENRLLQAVQGSLQQGLDGPTLLQNLNEIDANLREVRKITGDAFRQTYGNRGQQRQSPQVQQPAPLAGTYNWTPDGGLQRAR